MDKNKILAIITISGIALASSTLAREIPGKVSWLEADINADGVISFAEFQEKDQFDTGQRDTDGDGLLSLDEFLQPHPKKADQLKLKERHGTQPEDSFEKRESFASKKFEKMDTDFNGFLDTAELQDARFDTIDRNGDGVLSGKELKLKRQFRRPKSNNPGERKARGRGQEKKGAFKRSWRQWQRH